MYENKRIKVITGTNYASFTMDKQAEQYFDDSMLKFFKKTRHQYNADRRLTSKSRLPKVNMIFVSTHLY